MFYNAQFRKSRGRGGPGAKQASLRAPGPPSAEMNMFFGCLWSVRFWGGRGDTGCGGKPTETANTKQDKFSFQAEGKGGPGSCSGATKKTIINGPPVRQPPACTPVREHEPCSLGEGSEGGLRLLHERKAWRDPCLHPITHPLRITEVIRNN